MNELLRCIKNVHIIGTQYTIKKANKKGFNIIEEAPTITKIFMVSKLNCFAGLLVYIFKYIHFEFRKNHSTNTIIQYFGR